ncbi:MAG: hypothetical protein ACRD9R_20160 [Pyrinomonadaceae bacterium]
MVAKKKSTGQVKVGKLKLNKETLKDLSTEEAKQVKGGARPRPASGGGGCTASCNNQWTCACG